MTLENDTNPICSDDMASRFECCLNGCGEQGGKEGTPTESNEKQRVRANAEMLACAAQSLRRSAQRLSLPPSLPAWPFRSDWESQAVPNLASKFTKAECIDVLIVGSWWRWTV